MPWGPKVDSLLVFGMAFERKLIESSDHNGSWENYSLRWESLAPLPILKDTLQGINISPLSGIFEDDFPFPQVGYVSFLEGMRQTKVGVLFTH